MAKHPSPSVPGEGGSATCFPCSPHKRVPVSGLCEWAGENRLEILALPVLMETAGTEDRPPPPSALVLRSKSHFPCVLV